MTITSNEDFYRGFTVEAQGDLFAIATRYNYKRGKISQRGKVLSFSKKSRNRFMKKVARLDHERFLPIFITLTYPIFYPNPRRAMQNMQAFVKRIQRLHPACSGVWRIEFQERGAPHFHLLFWNLPYIDKEHIRKMWGEVIQYDKPFTRIEAVRTRHGVMRYMSKYLAKLDQSDGYKSQSGLLTLLLCGAMALVRSGGFIYEPYPDGFRRWGVINKSGLPWAVRQIYHLLGKIDLAVWCLRGYAQNIWTGMPRARSPAGFTLFTASSYHLFYTYVALRKELCLSWYC